MKIIISFLELGKRMQGHLTTKPLLITEHFSGFISASQKRESPFAAYATKFKKLSKHYKFGEKFNDI